MVVGGLTSAAPCSSKELRTRWAQLQFPKNLLDKGANVKGKTALLSEEYGGSMTSNSEPLNSTSYQRVILYKQQWQLNSFRCFILRQYLFSQVFFQQQNTQTKTGDVPKDYVKYLLVKTSTGTHCRILNRHNVLVNVPDSYVFIAIFSFHTEMTICSHKTQSYYN